MTSPAVQLLRDAAGRRIVDEDGNETTIALAPPLSAAELVTLEASIPCALPPDARELLSFARGFDGGPLESLDFAGVDEPIFDEVSPCALPIAHDGFGNFWVVDLTSDSTHWGPVVYICHDPPVVVHQCDDIATFIADVLRLAESPWDGPVDDVHEKHSMRIWRQNPHAVSRDVVLGHDSADTADVKPPDAVLRAFAERLTSEHFITDRRDAKTGDGFSWGRFGPQTPVTRAGNDRIFAVQRVSRGSRIRHFFLGGR
jgi:cell wall assembly regulator SMI1